MKLDKKKDALGEPEIRKEEEEGLTHNRKF